MGRGNPFYLETRKDPHLVKHKPSKKTCDQEAFARNVGHWIHYRRRTKGWSQHELARAANSAANMISAYECGKTLPSAYTLYKIAESLGVSVAYLCRPFDPQD